MTETRNFWKIFIPLLFFFLGSGILLAVADKLTRDKITHNARILELRVLDSVMPLAYDNDMYDDYIKIDDMSNDAVHTLSVFRARKDGQPAGVVFMPVPATGYSGAILLAIGLAWDGSLLGVRVLRHKETPGLGDRIDPARSDWIIAFTGRSLENPPVSEWAVQADGGQFDQLSGATITSRGVVNAVRQTLEYYRTHRDRLYRERGKD